MKKKPIAPELASAIAEAERFLEKARALQQAMEARASVADEYRSSVDPTCSPKLNAAAKRSSMDLSNALAAFRRRPQW